MIYIPLFCVLAYYLVIFIRNTLRGRVATEVVMSDLNGQCFCITGGSRGIGFCVVQTIVHWGGSVILGVRNVQSAHQKMKQSLTPVEMSRVEIYELNLASFTSVRAFAKIASCDGQKTINGLINNAHHSGLTTLHVTEDNIEYSYQVNYLSHFLLTMLLLPSLNRQKIGSSIPSRIINVGSRTYQYGNIQREAYNCEQRNLTTYDPNCIYTDTKLMQFLFSKELATRCANSGFNVSSDYVHPGGLVRTASGWTRGVEFSLMHRFEPTLMWLAGTDVEVAARSILNLVTRRPLIVPYVQQDSTRFPKVRVQGGRYFDTTFEVNDSDEYRWRSDSLWLWNTSCDIVGVARDVI